MTLPVAHDPMLCAQKIAAARESRDWPACVVQGRAEDTRLALLSLADQLEAACGEVSRLRAVAACTLLLAKPVTRTDIYEQLRADVYRGAGFAEPSEAAPFSTARDALRMERDALRAAVERMLPVVASLEALRDANATSNAIALANDRAMCPDTGAQRRADREEAGAVRVAVAAFDAYRAASALMKKG